MPIRHHMRPMAGVLVDQVGFSPPILSERARKRRDRIVAELITTAALVVSLAIALTAVSIGIARAGASLGDVAIVCVR